MAQKYLLKFTIPQFCIKSYIPFNRTFKSPHKNKVNKLGVRYTSLHRKISAHEFNFTNNFFVKIHQWICTHLKCHWEICCEGLFFLGKEQVPLQHHEINSKTQNWESAIMAGSGRNFTSAAAYKSRRTRRQLVWQHRDSIHCKHGNPSEHQLFRRSCISEIMARTRHDVRLLILGFCFWIKVRILF